MEQVRLKANVSSPQQSRLAGAQLGAGLGLKLEHLDDILALPRADTLPAVESLWFEVHTENYFVAGGPRLNALRSIRDNYDVSFHGVGGSLGYDHQSMHEHIQQVKALINEFQPVLVSEHAVWSRSGGTYFADLMPLPRTQDALQSLVDGVDRFQSGIGRRILIENPSNYLDFTSEMDEPAFLVEAARRSGCGLLIDINNLYLSSKNTGIDAAQYLSQIPVELVGEIHIAGHDPDPELGQALLIDSHASPVDLAVWELLQYALTLFGHQPVLVERDANLPPFAELMNERQQAQDCLEQCRHEAASANVSLGEIR
ncbi:DUF692 domain-containing protein [Amphritea sp. 1_MG-2023]|uniref:MNIO family bufferin maturase n=1 Tax=Amphritea sp. 1_MG-2023 TaxID=3062670 RepID=UPI0026E13CA4|nr:DUF692 domain-containing protein [Amphritea sp. 1_MG-2023]MDO6563759.1 DUF692 domain-containing protein [Amphritea sp. 1_MG-2023]